MSWFGSWGGAWGGAQAGGSAASSGGATYTVGEIVEYYSASSGNWIPAKVMAVNPKGTYNLDCKPDVPPEKIRKAASASPGGDYAVGEIIEYWSASQNAWIPAKVLAKNANGTYNLDCKPDVLPDKIRRKGEYRAPPSGNLGSGPLGSGLLGSGPLSSTGNLRDTGSLGSQGWLSGLLAPSTAPRVDKRPGAIEAPVQLLRVRRNGSRWQYEVCEEGAKALEQFGARRISIVSICGLYRTGKSYLLNLLLERVQKKQKLFQVGSTSRPCTEGLWLWGNVESDDERSPLLAFIDCEGFGSTDSDRTRDAQLMTLCALLSSVLVLNTKGVLNESLFNALALTCKFAEHIEERGNEASRPVLMWVLRDFMLELRDAAGRPTTPDEYLEQALHAAPPGGSLDQDRGRGAREVRQGLLKFFSHRSCHTLVQPALDEVALQKLATAPYSSLRSEFRAGVEALRTQLVTTCRANPKTVGGQPLGCYAFVALVRSLVTSMNEQKVLSVKGSWETVQHTSCGSLADDLRNSATTVLRALSAGQQISGGAQLPLTDENLRMVLRHQRHELKAQWEERAVGDEAVRKEYWQELKESLAREEAVVRQQNARIADQQLVASLRAWQDWLDDDAGAWTVGERITKDLGSMMERMPAAPLSRSARAAIEAAGRRVAAARSAIAATAQHSSEAQRSAIAFGEQAAQQEGAARSQLEAKHKELQEHQEQLGRHRQEAQRSQVELESLRAELQEAKAQLQGMLSDLDSGRTREHDLKAQHRALGDREASLKAELESVRAAHSRAEAEHLAQERLANAAADTAVAERRRLEAELDALKGQAADHHGLKQELEAVRGQANEHGMERSKLQSELEHARTQAAEKARLEAELQETKNMSASDRARLESELAHLRAQASEKRRLEEELHEAKRQADEKRRLEYELEHHKGQAADKKKLESELDKLRRDIASEAAEKVRLASELENAKSKADSMTTGLQAERDSLRNENERTRAEHLRVLEETRRKLEEERKIHADTLDGEKNRLLDRERNAGILEGQVTTLTAEAKVLREQVAALQTKLGEAESNKAQEVARVKQDLDKVNKEKAEALERQKQQADEHQRQLEEVEMAKGKKGKCGCSVQ